MKVGASCTVELQVSAAPTTAHPLSPTQTIRTQLEELMPIHVIWMSGSKIVAYRGKDYVKSVIEQPPQPQQQQPQPHDVPSEAFLEPS